MEHQVTSRPFAELNIDELHDILQLRSDVFVVEQECVYLDVDGRDREPTTMHHWIERDGSIVAYLRVLRDPDGTARIGRVVTAPHARSEGLAAELVRAAGSSVHVNVALDAQRYLVAWYELLGYEVAGEEFVEHGISHVPMRRA